MAREGDSPSARREQIEEIVIATLALAGTQRAAHLDSACRGDRELRREVESLLEQEHRASAFLEIPAIEVAARALAAGDSARIAGRVVGPYRIDALLGAGGMGEVYRAWDTRLRRPVALKFLAREFLSDAMAVERFEREARAASALNHPNICTVYDVGEMDGRPFIAMEYLEGQTLRGRLGDAALPPRKALEYAVQIAHGLVAADQKGIVHRDLKPENLWVTSEDRIKILDFGLAQLSETAMHPENAGVSTVVPVANDQGWMMGTVGYMSPEQVRGQPLDHRTDIFSFGAILHEMLTGKRAFHGPAALDTLIAILNTEPPPLSDPAGQLVRRCLAKDPERRFQSATDLAVDLEALLGKLEASLDENEAKRALFPRRRILLAGAGAASLAGLAALWEWLPGPRRNKLLRSSAPRITKLAVLPLENLSGDVQQEYFADGMTDLLITDLGQIGALRVISRRSTMQFKGTKTPASEIADQLGVDALVTGTMQSSPARVRITAHLVDPATGQDLWSQDYERERTDVLLLQSEVARAIAYEIQVRVTDDEAARLSRAHKVGQEAFSAYTIGRFYWDQFTDRSLLRAIDYFTEAIRLDPTYAEAYGGLAECWSGFLFTDSSPWEETISKAQEAANTALKLDGQLAESHQAMAVVLYQKWDWNGVESEVKKAIALNPGFSTAHMLYCNMLRHLGRAEESIREGTLASKLDPLFMLTSQMLGDAYVSAGQYELAIQQFLKALELHPNNSTLQYQLGWAYVYNNAYKQGIDLIRSSQDAEGEDPRYSPDLAYINAKTGKRDQARRTLNRLLAGAKNSSVSPGMIAIVHVALDERAQALDWLEKAFHQHSSVMTWLKVDPRFATIRDEPRFQALMRRVGLV